MRIQRIQFLEKYAARAEDLLSEKYGNNYTSEDVEKLAEALISMDVERAAKIERVEDLIKQARHTAKGFVDEINSNLGEGVFQKLASAALLGAFKNVIKGAKHSELGQKIMGVIGQTGQRARKFVKTDPHMAAGLGAGVTGTALIGSSLMDND
jgi:hypothetical protein